MTIFKIEVTSCIRPQIGGQQKVKFNVFSLSICYDKFLTSKEGEYFFAVFCLPPAISCQLILRFDASF